MINNRGILFLLFLFVTEITIGKTHVIFHATPRVYTKPVAILQSVHNIASLQLTPPDRTADTVLLTKFPTSPPAGLANGLPVVSFQIIKKGGNSKTILNTRLINNGLIPSILFFSNTQKIDADRNITPGATSNNNETPIVYTSDNPAVAVITADGHIHIVGPGTAHITVTQAGNSHYSAATPIYSTLTIIYPQRILLPIIPDKRTCDADFKLAAASTNPSIPLSYSSSNTNVATISAQGIIHIIAPGTTTITVSQPGNDLYNAAPPQKQTLTINPPAKPTIQVTPDAFGGCDGMSVTYTAVVTDQGSNPFYQWQVNGVDAGTNSIAFTSSTLHSGDKITCKVTNTTDCTTTPTAVSNTASIQTEPYTTPLVSIKSSSNGYVCSGTVIIFTATPTNGGNNPQYRWKINNIPAGTNSNIFSTDLLSDGDFVTCELTVPSGSCMTTLFALSNVVDVKITTSQISSVSISASATDVYSGMSVAFTATTSNSAPGITYQWQVNGSNAGTNSPTFTSNRLNDGDVVTCNISGGTICVVPATSQPVTMHVLAPKAIPIPNTFTPNSDGVNDSWNIPALAYYPNCVVNIFNRYGTKVYESKGYHHSWDGTINGKMLPVSTYYYMIDLGIDQQKLSGPITIIR